MLQLPTDATPVSLEIPTILVIERKVSVKSSESNRHLFAVTCFGHRLHNANLKVCFSHALLTVALNKKLNIE